MIFLIHSFTLIISILLSYFLKIKELNRRYYYKSKWSIKQFNGKLPLFYSSTIVLDITNIILYYDSSF